MLLSPSLGPRKNSDTTFNTVSIFKYMEKWLIEALTVAHLVTIFPTIQKSEGSHRTQKRVPLKPILLQMNAGHIRTVHYFIKYFCNTLPPNRGLPSNRFLWSLPSKFCIILSSRFMCAPRHTNPFFLNNIW